VGLPRTRRHRGRVRVFAVGSLTAIVARTAPQDTLLHAIAGLVVPRYGSIELQGQIPRRSRLPARRFPSTGTSVSVLEFAALGGWARIGASARPPGTAVRGTNALKAVGLDELAGRMLGELSVGSSAAPCSPASSCRKRRRPSRRAVRRRRRGHERRPAESCNAGMARAARDGCPA